MAVPSEGPIEVITRAAADLAKDVISAELPSTVELLLDRVDVYEVWWLRQSPLGPFLTSCSRNLRISKHIIRRFKRFKTLNWTAIR